jgi:hypothetical protein
MSDDNFMLEDDEEENYNFDYEDDEQEEPDVDLENKYYNAKGRFCQLIKSLICNFLTLGRSAVFF